MITGLGGNRDSRLGRHEQNLAHTKTQRKGAATQHKTEPKLAAGVGGSPVEAWVGRGSPQGWGHWQHRAGKVCLGINPLGGRHQPDHRACSPQGWVTSGQKLPGSATHPSADNWIKVLLSKALPTTADPVFPITSPSRQVAYSSLLASSIRGQTEQEPESHSG